MSVMSPTGNTLEKALSWELFLKSKGNHADSSVILLFRHL